MGAAAVLRRTGRIAGGFVRWTLVTVLGLLLVLIVAGITGAEWLRGSLPAHDGTLRVPGLSAPVTIDRDADGIPHIRAGSPDDAYFALGFVHAQDRLFQMEMQRRLGAGRTAEVIGPPGLRLDRFTRTVGLYRRAEESYAALRPETRAALDAYAAGVNAWITRRPSLLPPEFQLLGVDPEPWRPADSLVWGKLMAMQLSGSWRGDLMRQRILQTLGEDALDLLHPPYPADGPRTQRARLPDPGDLPDPERLLAVLPHELIGNGASNQWVVSGARTVSGKPVLANDPHLGLSAPILWYLARLEAPGLSVTGATVPGAPFTIIGHNGTIAWGVTTPYVDTTDLFVERVDPDDPGRYLVPGGSMPFVEREEVIRVRFGADVTLRVRETRHGPILDPDVLGESALRIGGEGAPRAGDDRLYALAADWLIAPDTTADAVLAINTAHDWASFREALRRYIAPTQSLVFADTAGNIGHIVPGRLPIRKAGDGRVPVPGWTGEYGWTGTIPFDELPQSLNPPAGILVNANNPVAPASYPYSLGSGWGEIYRAQRIEGVLRADRTHDREASQRLQLDILSLKARDLLPLMLRDRGSPVTPSSLPGMAARERLARWDYRMDRNAVEPLLFTAWFTELARRLYDDELRPLAGAGIGPQPAVVKAILTGRRDWCNDVTTTATESCAEILAASLDTAVAALQQLLGRDMDGWRWGDLHYAEMSHPVFGMLPPLRPHVTLRIATDGGNSTVNKATPGTRWAGAGGRGGNPFRQVAGAGLRFVIDMAAPDEARFVVAPGQSGNPYSPLFGSFLQRWRDGAFVTIGRTRDAPPDGGARLVLEPGED